MLLDQANRLWIGTWGGGLSLFDPETQIFRNFTVQDGLPGNYILAIDEGPDGNLWIGSHPKMFDFIKHAKNKDHYSPSQVIMISSKDNEIKEVFLSDGSDLSGSSVAALYNNNLLIGAVFEDHFLHCVLD